jgi:hypothetical protein
MILDNNPSFYDRGVTGYARWRDQVLFILKRYDLV